MISKSDKQKRKKSPLLIFIPLTSHLKFSSSPSTISLIFLSIFPFFLASLLPSSSFPLPSHFPHFPLPSKISPKLSKGGRLSHLAHPELHHCIKLLSLQLSAISHKYIVGVFRGYCTPNLKLPCSVCYLKIINTSVRKLIYAS